MAGAQVEGACRQGISDPSATNHCMAWNHECRDMPRRVEPEMTLDHWIAREADRRRKEERKAIKAAALTLLLSLSLIGLITLIPH